MSNPALHTEVLFVPG